MSTPLGDYIRARRDDLGLTQTDLADRALLQRAHLSEIERGKIALPNAVIRRNLAGALGVSHLDLLVAAGEITQEELGTVAGIVERNPDDPREQLIQAIRQTPMPDHYAVGLIRMLETWQVDALRSSARASRPQSAE